MLIVRQNAFVSDDFGWLRGKLRIFEKNPAVSWQRGISFCRKYLRIWSTTKAELSAMILSGRSRSAGLSD
jgi:hypothetical protein